MDNQYYSRFFAVVGFRPVVGINVVRSASSQKKVNFLNPKSEMFEPPALPE